MDPIPTFGNLPFENTGVEKQAETTTPAPTTPAPTTTTTLPP